MEFYGDMFVTRYITISAVLLAAVFDSSFIAGEGKIGFGEKSNAITITTTRLHDAFLLPLLWFPYYYNTIIF